MPGPFARRVLRTGCATVAVVGWSLCESAHAFDFFGLFGSDDPPPVSATTLSYRLVIEAKTADGKDDSDAEQALRDASATYRLRQEPPPDGEGLVSCAACRPISIRCSIPFGDLAVTMPRSM